MRAATFSRFGGPEVITVKDLPTPTPGVGEILVRVAAASVGSSDAAGRSGEPKFARLMFGLRGPRDMVLGSDFAGTVESTGDGVTEWSPGDRVFGATGATMRAHAEFIVVRADGAVAALPAEVSYEQAVALTDGAMTALPFLRDTGSIRSGMRVLVNGASGAVGAAAVQLAKHFGAHVTAVTSSRNETLVRELGADRVINYEAIEFTGIPDRFDIVFDAVGLSSFARARRILTPQGRYLTTVPGLVIVQSLFTKRARLSLTGLRKDADKRPDLAELALLTASGVLGPLIDGVYPMREIRQAHARVDSGRKRGTVIVAPRG